MKVYQVNISMPKSFSDELVSLIPKQRRVINELLQKGVLESYALSADRSKAWCAVNASSEKDVREIFSTFPLIRFMKLEITELSWYNEVQLAFPPLMLN